MVGVLLFLLAVMDTLNAGGPCCWRVGKSSPMECSSLEMTLWDSRWESSLLECLLWEICPFLDELVVVRELIVRVLVMGSCIIRELVG